MDSSAARRTYAAYGGVCIAASLAWLWSVEGLRPHRWDVTGVAFCIVGAGIIIPRTTTGNVALFAVEMSAGPLSRSQARSRPTRSTSWATP